MKNSLKSWVSRFVREIESKSVTEGLGRGFSLVRGRPVGVVLAVTLVLLPAQGGEMPAVPQEPFLKKGPTLEGPTFEGWTFWEEGAAYPVEEDTEAPAVAARGVYVVDVDSMVPILTKNPDEKLRPASTTKIMTALVAMEAFVADDVVTSRSASDAIGKSIRLKSGEQVAFTDMVYGLMLESGNDVALALAENYPGGYEAMVEAMNQKAQGLKLSSTSFRNVSGIDQYQHETTARDLALLTVEAIKNDRLRQVVATREKEIRSIDGKIVHSLQNTNELLGTVEGVLGVKTGWTALAGENLVTYVERGPRRVILVVLGSADRVRETEKLIDWVFENHQWKNSVID